MIPKLYIKHYALGIVLLAVLFGCTTEAERNRMRAGLDSINVLNRTDQPFTPDDVRPYVDFFDKEAKAFFTLLSSDSIHNDQLLAHYLLGRAYHEKGDAPMALESYQHAIDHADTTSAYCDYRQLSRVYAQMAEIFYQQNLYPLQIESYQQAINHSLRSGNTQLAINDYERLASAYEAEGRLDTALSILDSVSSWYKSQGLINDAAITMGRTTSILLELRQYNRAHDYMTFYEQKSGLFDSLGTIRNGFEIYYYYKGLLLLKRQRLDSAEYFFRKVMSSKGNFNHQNAGAYGLAQLFEEKAQADSAMKYYKCSYALNDSLYAHAATEEISQMKALYDYTLQQEIARKKTEEAESEHSKRQFTVMLLLLVASIAAIVIYKMYIDRKKKQVLYLKTLEQLEQTQSDILCLRSHAEENEELISEKEHQLERLNTIMQEYRKNAQHNNAIIDKRIKDTDIYQTLLQKQHGQKLTHDELRECRRLVLENLPNINNLLLSKEYKLNDKDYNVCILFRLGFKSKEVSNMLDVSQGRVSQISSKMLQVLFHESTGGASELIEKLYDI